MKPIASQSNLLKTIGMRQSSHLIIMQSKLKIGSGSSQTEGAFVMGTCGQDGLCSDMTFPPGPSSL